MFDPEDLAVFADRHHLERSSLRRPLDHVRVEAGVEARREVDQSRFERGRCARAPVLHPGRFLRHGTECVAFDRVLLGNVEVLDGGLARAVAVDSIKESWTLWLDGTCFEERASEPSCQPSRT